MRNIIALGLLATISLLTGQAQAIPLDAGNDSYPYPTTYPDFSYPDFDGGIILFPPYYDGGIGLPEVVDAGGPPTEEPPLALDAGSSSAAPISSAAPDTSAAVTSGGPGTSGPNETEEPVTEPSGETGSTTGDVSNTGVVVETSSEPVGGGIDAGSTDGVTDAVTIPAETSSPAASGTVTSDESPTSGNEGNDTSEAPGNDTSEAPGNDTSDDEDGTTEDDDLPTVVADAGVDAGGFVDDGGGDEGCDCRVAGGPQTNTSKFGGLAFAGLAFIAMGRRRQRRA